jgi:UV DNA damage endonuclease
MTAKLGLCCISEILKDDNHAFQTLTRTYFNKMKREDALIKLRAIASNNFTVTRLVIEHCQKIRISHYRLSSSLLPLVTCSETFPDYRFEQSLYKCDAFDNLKACVQKALKNGFSFSSHPGQFVVLGSTKPDVVEASIRELEFHARLHDALGLPQNHSNPINIHVGCSPQNGETIDEFVARFYEGYFKLSYSVRNRLTLENDDKGVFNCENLYNTFGENFVLCYDNLHNIINPSAECGKFWREKYQTTWNNFTPIFHWSEGLENNAKRSHTEFVSHFPVDFEGFSGILEVEVKMKDKAILQFLKNNG